MIIEGTSTAGDITIRGDFPPATNASTFTGAGGTITQTQRYGTDQINAQCDLAISDAEPIDANVTQILGTALTETSGGYLAAGVKKFFDKATPTGTINSLPDAVAGATGGVFIAGTNAATAVTTGLTANITGNLSGSVGSLATQAKADVNAECDSALSDYGANTTVPDAAGVVATALGNLETHGDSEWATATGFNTVVPDAAGTAKTLTAAYDAAKTASQAGDAMALVTDAVSADALSAAAVVEIVSGLEADGIAYADMMTAIMATLFGKATVAGSTVTYKKRDGSTVVITVTNDSVGNRTASTLT